MGPDELASTSKSENDINKDSLLENLVLYVVSMFCAGTESRFMTQLEKGRDYSEAERWQSKSVYMACTFMPDSCPIVDHLAEAYIKNFTGPSSLLLNRGDRFKKSEKRIAPLPSRVQTTTPEAQIS